MTAFCGVPERRECPAHLSLGATTRILWACGMFGADRLYADRLHGSSPFTLSRSAPAVRPRY